MPTPKLRVSSTPPQVDRHVVAVVHEALVPMFLWLDIPVNRVTEHRMTVLERFLLEAALEFRPLIVEEVAEVIGAPVDLVTRIARRLTTLQLLTETGDSYEAVPPAARQALAQAALLELRPGHLTFLFLPRSGELLAFEPDQGKRGAPLLHRVAPAYTAPTPASVRGRGRVELLRQRVAEQTVLGLPADFGDILEPDEDDDEPVATQCPVYRCSGTVRMHGDEVRVHLSVYNGPAPGERQRRRKRGGSQATLELAGVDALTRAWVDRTAELGSPPLLQRVLQALGSEHNPEVTAARTGPVEWTLNLDSETASSIASAKTLLTDTIGVEDHGEEHIIATGVRFAPADPAASVLFAVDEAAARVRGVQPDDLQTRDLLDSVAAAQRARELPDGSIDHGTAIDRLWTFGSYQQVYALRRAEDFAYA